MFNIHSVGDVDFLARILNAVAMIFGTGDFERLVMIGLLLGVIVIMVQGLFRGAQQINWQQILLGWLVYACMFGPTSTVVIDSSYNGRTHTVDNVPIGVAFAGSMISNVGYGITQLFETAYGDVASVTRRQYMEPLKVINGLRSNAVVIAAWQALDTAVGGANNVNTDLAKSWQNYVQDCTMVKMTLGSVSASKLYKNDSFQNMHFDSQVHGTRIYISGREKNQTCGDAWAHLNAALGQLNNAAVNREINKVLGVMDADGTVQVGLTAASSAMQALGMSGTSAQEYIRLAMLEPIYLKGAQNFYKVMGDTTSAYMVNSAIKQRNMQWAAESTMFGTVVRPFLTFFEGFTYAVTPVLAFLVVLGGLGMTLGVKYIQLIMWIQLWYPVMSITNLFVVMSARAQLVSATDGAPKSFYALDGACDILENWIATGGMLFAATPLIALFLITGSTYAFTTLTSRMQGGDHVNEKVTTPDIMGQNPFYQQDTYGSKNAMQGGRVTGSDKFVAQTAMQSGAQQMVASARQDLETNTDSLMRTIRNIDTTGWSDDQKAALTKLRSEVFGAGTVEATGSTVSRTAENATLTSSGAGAAQATTGTSGYGASIGPHQPPKGNGLGGPGVGGAQAEKEPWYKGFIPTLSPTGSANATNSRSAGSEVKTGASSGMTVGAGKSDGMTANKVFTSSGGWNAAKLDTVGKLVSQTGSAELANAFGRVQASNKSYLNQMQAFRGMTSTYAPGNNFEAAQEFMRMEKVLGKEPAVSNFIQRVAELDPEGMRTQLEKYSQRAWVDQFDLSTRSRQESSQLQQLTAALDTCAFSQKEALQDLRTDFQQKMLGNAGLTKPMAEVHKNADVSKGMRKIDPQGAKTEIGQTEQLVKQDKLDPEKVAKTKADYEGQAKYNGPASRADYMRLKKQVDQHRGKALGEIRENKVSQAVDTMYNDPGASTAETLNGMYKRLMNITDGSKAMTYEQAERFAHDAHLTGSSKDLYIKMATGGFIEQTEDGRQNELADLRKAVRNEFKAAFSYKDEDGRIQCAFDDRSIETMERVQFATFLAGSSDPSTAASHLAGAKELHTAINMQDSLPGYEETNRKLMNDQGASDLNKTINPSAVNYWGNKALDTVTGFVDRQGSKGNTD